MKNKIEELKIDLWYWYDKQTINFCIWFARKFPKIALWCFIVVYGEDGNAPEREYSKKYRYWKNKYKLEDM